MRFPLIPAILTWAAAGPTATAGTVQFNRDIRPILSENCFHCHGQDAAKRKADLRLDTFAGATAALENGPALVPGKPEASALLQRMTSHDPDEKMPPPESNRRVGEQQIELVRKWIAEGGEYQTHWAFVPPVRADLPAPHDWDRQPWDAWVRVRLDREGLQPSPEAKPEAWLRRVSFDLTGLAPTPGELVEFADDVRQRGESAYNAAVERLLASPRYGERMAADWMDAARYADTHGFNNDSARSMWRWRDWVIQAFNQNLPYDQFITKQLAGDLLPEATLDDRIATGFGRNHVINSEGGIIDEEYRVEYVADRVRTLGMTWLGLTMECSRCHDHKYDPISAKDYYQLYAFFNQVPEWGEDGRAANAAPILPAPTDAQQKDLADLQRDIAEQAAAEPALPAALSTLGDSLTWLKNNMSSAPEPGKEVFRPAVVDNRLRNALHHDQICGETNGVTLDPQLGTVLTFPAAQDWKVSPAMFKSASNQAWTWATGINWQGGEGVLISSMAYSTAESSVSHGAGMEIRVTKAGQVEVRMAERWPAYAMQILSKHVIQPDRWHHIAVVNQGAGGATGCRLFIDGVESGVTVRHDGVSGASGARGMVLGRAEGKSPDKFHGKLADLRIWHEALPGDVLTSLSDRQLRAVLSTPEGWSEGLSQLARVQAVLRRHHPETQEAARARNVLWTKQLELQRSFPSVMVMSDLPQPRPTHVLMRGTYDAPGESVTAGVPEALLGAWPEGAPRNRLGLAQWLTMPSQPLTARVVVNRFWQQIFGTGPVRTPEDFGFQSEYPSHPELLDWLARDFADGGWNVKNLLRSIVLSATYRQDSAVPPALAARDPENILLARGPRLRLAAEMIRDHALAVSGLLKEKTGGPSVFPDQPPDLYKGVVVDAAYPGTKWNNSTGDDLYRRSLYTFWKRTVPHPVMNVFDTPDREFGCVRRSRTNTPLQALTLMNEPALLRAAGHLSQRIQRESGPEDKARLTYGFTLVTSRTPAAPELGILTKLLDKLRQSYQSDAAGARAMLESGAVPVPPEHPAQAEAAAWTALASNLLNLDETLTKN